jgi:hypothetical protein
MGDPFNCFTHACIMTGISDFGLIGRLRMICNEHASQSHLTGSNLKTPMMVLNTILHVIRISKDRERSEPSAIFKSKSDGQQSSE